MTFQRSVILFASALALAATGCGKTANPVGGVASGQELFQLCTQCHAPDGNGNPLVNAPAIAGLEQWYVEAQLRKFRNGARGTHIDDHAGMQMRPMAISIPTDGDLQTVAAYVASLPKKRQAPTLTGGDPIAGQALFTVCTACHGPAAAGNQQLGAPPLNHASDWYMLTQLRHFKDGVRGTNPIDTTGATMRPMAKTLADEQAMKNVIAYVMTLQ
jgi:cytochrome c oxidase subunit 2